MPPRVPLPEAEERVLSTLNADGSRRWLYPRPSQGRFLTARRVTAYLLIAVFTLLPYLKMGGKPIILLDIVNREFTLFGFTFLPTDTVLLALFLAGFFVSIFLITALFGRLWCGWSCPQTVYMELVYRPIERLFDGPPRGRGKPGAKRSGVRLFLKYVVFVLVSMLLAHTFLAYFVGVESLWQWMRRSPFEHPVSFLVMVGTTVLMILDFVYFREQTCIVACPYGRFQSVMLDRDSLIISYDHHRGEPRGKAGPGEDAARGDCIDCHLCVTTCPTGIDIRDGLKMECVACAQCIDACDAVMDKIGKPRGLVRYSSQAAIDGKPARRIRPRIVLYPLILVVLASLFGVTLARKSTADVTVLRGLGSPFTVMPDGRVLNQLRIRLTNRTSGPAAYTVDVIGEGDIELFLDENPVKVAAGESRTRPLLIKVPESVFRNGRSELTLRIGDGKEFSREIQCRMLGPTKTTK